MKQIPADKFADEMPAGLRTKCPFCLTTLVSEDGDKGKKTTIFMNTGKQLGSRKYFLQAPGFEAFCPNCNHVVSFYDPKRQERERKELFAKAASQFSSQAPENIGHADPHSSIRESSAQCDDSADQSMNAIDQQDDNEETPREALANSFRELGLVITKINEIFDLNDPNNQPTNNDEALQEALSKTLPPFNGGKGPRKIICTKTVVPKPTKETTTDS